ncbi:MAG TPA: hypothetical protein VGD14_23625 [bacterium]
MNFFEVTTRFNPSTAKLQNKYSTPRSRQQADSPFGEHEANIHHGGFTKIKNNNYFNLPLCPFWFLRVRRKANPRQLADGISMKF